MNEAIYRDYIEMVRDLVKLGVSFDEAIQALNELIEEAI